MSINKKSQFNIDIELKFKITYQDFLSYLTSTHLVAKVCDYLNKASPLGCRLGGGRLGATTSIDYDIDVSGGDGGGRLNDG